MLPRASHVFGFTGVAVVILAASARAQERVHAGSQTAHPDSAARVVVTPMTFGDKAALYSSRTFSLRAVAGASYAAGLAQWRKTPKEWGSGMSGYGRRDAAAYGGGIIRNTVEFSIGALFHEDPRFERSIRNGLVPRTVDALNTTLFVRTDDNNHRIAWSRAAAAIATGFAVNS